MTIFLTGYPEPKITSLTQAFWEGCKQGRLLIQRCDDCAKFRFYPTETCPSCRSTRFTWSEVTGKGQVASWIVIHRSVDPIWQSLTPFISGVVEIDEQVGCWVPGLILGIEPDRIQHGLTVQVEFEQTGEKTFVHRWRAIKN